MKRLLAGLPALLLCGAILAAPPKIVGPKDPVAPYKLVELSAEGDLTGAAVVWDVQPEDQADVREMAGGKLVFTGPPGTYRIKVLVIRVKDGAVTVDTQRATVVIGAPTPPIPPVPPPPLPDDPLVKALTAAWAQETDPQKVQQLATMLTVYRYTAINTVNDDKIKTVADVLASFQSEEAKRGVVPTTLPKYRRAVADYLNTQIGRNPTTVVDKLITANTFNAVITASGGLK